MNRAFGQIHEPPHQLQRLREFAVSQLAHAFGEVHRGAAIGQFDSTPRPTDIEKDEQVGGPVALCTRSRSAQAVPARLSFGVQN
jgi:hypothetical protein